jgi:hypothetical protein
MIPVRPEQLFLLSSHLRRLPRYTVLYTLICIGLLVLVPGMARAQAHWTGIGAISGTVMFMDTTTIVRSGSIRRVWVKSLDITPKTVVAGKDTLSFDTVLGLNVFDCSKGTRVVTSVQYLLGDDVVSDVPVTHDVPALLRPKSFFGAIYNDLCRSER